MKLSQKANNLDDDDAHIYCTFRIAHSEFGITGLTHLPLEASKMQHGRS